MSGVLYFFVVLAVCSVDVQGAQFFCVGVDCKNVTLYLGPRFGSKIIQLSPLESNITSSVNITYDTNVTANSSEDFWRNLGRNANSQGVIRKTTTTTTTTAAPFWKWAPKVWPEKYGTYRPSTTPRYKPKVVYGTYPPFTPRSKPKVVYGTYPPFTPRYKPKVVYGTYPPFTPRYDSSKDRGSYNKPSLDYGTPVGPLIPRVRPVLPDGSQSVDMTADDIILHDADWDRPRKVLSVANALSKGLLDLTGQGLSGEDVKIALANLTSSNLTSTNRLMLNNNLIKLFNPLTFPVELEYSLNQLWMDDNSLPYLDFTTIFEISRLGNLKLLSLSNTDLKYFSTVPLPKLEVLCLKNNFLTEIPQGFNNLRQLHLTNNRISSVTPKDLASFTNLRLLDLSGNHLRSFYDHPFRPLMRLETLYLQNNSLTYTTDIDVPHSAILFLGHNPLVCTCELVELVNQRWPQVVDKERINCTDDMSRSFKPVSSVGNAPCRDPRRWWRLVGQTFEHIFRWCSRMGLNWHNISNFLYWILIIVAGCVIVKVVLAKNFFNFRIVRVPYNVLDEKHAFTDDKNALVENKNTIDDDNHATFDKTVLHFSDKIAIINDKNNL